MECSSMRVGHITISLPSRDLPKSFGLCLWKDASNTSYPLKTIQFVLDASHRRPRYTQIARISTSHLPWNNDLEKALDRPRASEFSTV